MATLCEVTKENELEELRKRMQEYLPQSAAIHGFLGVMLKFHGKDLNDSKVYIPKGAQPGSLVVITPLSSQPDIQSASVFWDTEQEDDADVLHSLRTLPDWEWSAPILYRPIPATVYMKIKECVQDGRLGNGQMQCQNYIGGYLFSRDTSSIPSFEIPEGFILDSLRPEDVPTLESYCNYPWCETAKCWRTIVSHLPSVAIRYQETFEKDTPPRLVFWSTMYFYGFLAHTFTLPEYRRRGLFQVGTLALAKKMKELGLPVRSSVREFNLEAMKVHQKLGFQKECSFGDFVVLPKTKTS